jgi:uncharacterized membrane protein YkvA (DUF1232 family)
LNQIQLTWRLLFDKRVPIWAKAIALAPIAYVILPFDFLPDFLIGVGQLDDLGLILAGMRLFESLVPEFIVQEHRAQIGGQPRPDNVVDGTSRRVERERERMGM